MVMRLLIFGLGVTIVQVVLFYLSMGIVSIFLELLPFDIGYDQGQDYILMTQMIFLPMVIFAQNLVCAVVNNQKVTKWLTVAATVVYVVGIVDLEGVFAVQSILYFTLGITVLASKIKLDEWLG